MGLRGGVSDFHCSILQGNPLDNFALAMRSKVESLMLDRMERNQEIVSKYLNDPQFQEVAFRLLVKRIYEELRGGAEREGAGG